MAMKKEPEGSPAPAADELQKMLEEARAAKEEAHAILEQANAALAAAREAQQTENAANSAEPEESETQRQERLFREEQERERQYMEEKVPIRLFKDNDKYKGDVLVCVNGERLLIKRGEDVMIPRKFALALEDSLRQDAATANLIETESAKFEAEAKARNI